MEVSSEYFEELTRIATVLHKGMVEHPECPDTLKIMAEIMVSAITDTLH